jgi:hypothetical protein
MKEDATTSFIFFVLPIDLLSGGLFALSGGCGATSGGIDKLSGGYRVTSGGLFELSGGCGVTSGGLSELSGGCDATSGGHDITFGCPHRVIKGIKKRIQDRMRWKLHIKKHVGTCSG